DELDELGFYLPDSRPIENAIRFHERLHHRLRMSQAATIIPTYRRYLEQEVFDAPLTLDHPFIRAFIKVYGKPHGEEMQSDTAQVDWVIEEFLVLTIQEAELFVHAE